MNTTIIGGDGFCGWPTALRLSELGHDVTIIDNLSRRKIDVDLGTSSLTPIVSIEDRIKAWFECTGRKIHFVNLDVAKNFEALISHLKTNNPTSIVHFGEQRAAPYSMRNEHTKNYTVENNVLGTHNLLNAVVVSGIKTHLVHLGTMGVYGYSDEGIQIPEGYLRIKTGLYGKEVEKEILYPPNPGSIYHLTKCLDQQLFHFYVKNDSLLITDLHQGIVWGTQTPETSRDERLINRFDYDGDYGTVLNRFIVQSQVGHPLTVNGTGGQTRAFININDTIRCIELAINNPPADFERVRIMNQMTETHKVRDLAKLIADRTGSEIQLLENPRREAAENELSVSNSSLRTLGLEPTLLHEELISEIEVTAKRYKARVDHSKIPARTVWVRQ